MATRRARVSAPTQLDAYVLHRYDWSESSLILELLTRERGRVAVIAKGAKRPTSQLRAILLPFQRVQVTLGRTPADDADIHVLRQAEWAGGGPLLPPAALFHGFYLNELLLKLLARHDPHPALWDADAEAVARLQGRDETGLQPVLRAFELILLRELGLLPTLEADSSTLQPLQPQARYLLQPETGLCLAPAHARSALPGEAWCALQQALEQPQGYPAVLRACAPVSTALKPLLRALLQYHCGSPLLRTRQLMMDLQTL